MKKLILMNRKLDEFDIIKREELKTIFGGLDGADCSADCGTDNCGQEVKVNCTGTSCFASDNVGCSSQTEAQTCSTAMTNANKNCIIV